MVLMVTLILLMVTPCSNKFTEAFTMMATFLNLLYVLRLHWHPKLSHWIAHLLTILLVYLFTSRMNFLEQIIWCIWCEVKIESIYNLVITITQEIGGLSIEEETHLKLKVTYEVDGIINPHPQAGYSWTWLSGMITIDQNSNGSKMEWHKGSVIGILVISHM